MAQLPLLTAIGNVGNPFVFTVDINGPVLDTVLRRANI